MEIKGLLREKGFRFKKNYGQNFLTDESLLDDIAAASGADRNDAVLEIGCGAGTLTRALSARAGRVVAVEIDRALAPVLERTLAGLGNVRVVFGDVMKMSLGEIEDMLGGEYRVVANLPYYITTPVLMKFIEGSARVKSLSVMVQEEVARRIAARAGTPDYGAITAAIDAVADAEIRMFVPRDRFFPVPNVDSAVAHIAMNRDKFGAYDREKYRAAVRAAFQSRRKTLVNNLMQGLGLSRERAERAVAAAGADALARGETLSSGQFVALVRYLSADVDKNQKMGYTE